MGSFILFRRSIFTSCLNCAQAFYCRQLFGLFCFIYPCVIHILNKVQCPAVVVVVVVVGRILLKYAQIIRIHTSLSTSETTFLHPCNKTCRTTCFKSNTGLDLCVSMNKLSDRLLLINC